DEPDCLGENVIHVVCSGAPPSCHKFVPRRILPERACSRTQSIQSCVSVSIAQCQRTAALNKIAAGGEPTSLAPEHAGWGRAYWGGPRPGRPSGGGEEPFTAIIRSQFALVLAGRPRNIIISKCLP